MLGSFFSQLGEMLFPKNDKLASLQGLRGYAILLIFISHSFMTNFTGSFGAYGVSIFIVLSGFLLGLKRTNYTNSIAKVTLSKISKVYPLHLLCMLSAIPLAINLKDISSSVIYILKCMGLHLFCVQSFVPIKSYYFSLNMVAWYLSILLLLAILSKPVKSLVGGFVSRFSVLKIFVAMLAIWLLLICYVSFCKGSQISHWLIYICPLVRMVDFLLGVMFGAIVVLKKDYLLGKINGGLAFTVLAIAIFAGGISCFTRGTVLHSYFYSVVWLPISLGLIFIGLKDGVKFVDFIFQNKFILAVGNLSLEIFLIHQLVIRYGGVVFKTNTVLGNLLTTLLYFVITMLAALTYRFLFENYFSRFVKTK